MKEFTIQDKQVTIHKFGAIEGWKLLHKITSVAGPAMGAASTRDYPQAVSIIFNRFSETETIALMKQCLEVCLIDGKKSDFSTDMQDYSFGFDLVLKVLEYNYGDFFFHIKKKVLGFIGEESAKKS